MARDKLTSDRIAPWVVLASMLLVTAVATQYVWNSSQIADRAVFDREARSTIDDIRFRLETYVNVLRAAGGLFAAGQNVTRDQFRAYVQALQVEKRHPGIQGIGISLRVRPQHVGDVIMDLRVNDFPEFRIWPEYARDEYHTIVLLEPLDRRNRAAIGYDMYTSPVRRRAMERARDTGEAAATAPLRLVQEIDPEEQRGFVIYVPIYTARGIPQTVEERRERLYGFVYAPFRAGDLFEAILAPPPSGMALSVHDGERLFYATERQPDGQPRYALTQNLNVAGRTWTVRLESLRGGTGGSLWLTAATAIGGVIIAVLLFALLRVQLRARARAEDVADRLRASEAELQAANRAKDEFLATLSHELRTPMTAIVGWSKLLSEHLDDETRAIAVDSIQKSSAAQAQLIDDLLDVSRITAGKMKIATDSVDLGPILSVAAAAVEPAADAKGINLEISVPENPVVVRGDAARLQQVVWNLLSNAVKFTPGGGQVTIRLSQREDEAVIDVIDTGEGIDPEFLPHVFERFRQADSSTTRVYTGLGLGLAIVRHLVELHGGLVTAHSEGHDKGSWFTVRLPLLRGDVPALEPETIRDRELTAVLDGARILVVDDEDDVRSYAGAVFRTGGADVTCVRSVDEALETLARWKPDVIVTDIGMPHRDGYDLLRSVRKNSSVPVVALTAYAREEDREHAEEAGFEAFVPKPVDPAELRSAVAGVLTARSASV